MPSNAAQARRRVIAFAASSTAYAPARRKTKRVLGTPAVDDKLLRLLEDNPGKCFGLEEIAQHTGLSKRTVRHIEDRALMKLAEVLCDRWPSPDLKALLEKVHVAPRAGWNEHTTNIAPHDFFEE